MKRKAIVFVTLVLVLLVAAGCVSAPEGPAPVGTTGTQKEARPQYIVGVDADFPPFAFRDGSGNLTGFDIEALGWIAEREGFSVSFVAVPWQDAFPSLEKGDIDILASGVTVTEERKARVNFTQPYYPVHMSIAARAGSNITLQDLYDGRLRIGVEAGTTEADWVNVTLVQTGKMPASNLSLYPDISTLTMSLENGTVDVSLIQSPSQKRVTAGRPLVIIGTIPSPETIAYAVRKTDPELLAILDDGLSRLMKDPFWQQLLQKYGLDA